MKEKIKFKKVDRGQAINEAFGIVMREEASHVFSTEYFYFLVNDTTQKIIKYGLPTVPHGN